MDIKQKLIRAIQTYYSGDQDSKDAISDEEYEELVAESGLGISDIEQLKRQSIVVVDKIKHKWPMTSLPKVFNLDDIKKNDFNRAWQLKYDGCSIEIHYNGDGIFDYACTRGDYTYGDNRTALVQELIEENKIPERINDKYVSVRGELLVSNEDWLSIQDSFKNQRNAASGIANRNDVTFAKFLTFIGYDIVEDESGQKNLYNKDAIGDNYDFTISPTYFAYEDAAKAFDNADVPVDGLVVKDYANGAKDCRYAIAYKFSDKTYETRITDVLWQMGKSGKLTPVATFDTVFIDAEVSRASLGSYILFKNLNLHYGDKIAVKKANMVIPQVVQNLGGGSNNLIQAPTYYNGKQVNQNGANLFVENDERWKNILLSQVSAISGKGIGPSFVDKCIDEYGVMDIFELYNVVFEDDFHIKEYGQKRIQNARDSMQKIESVSIDDLISSMGLDEIGWNTVEKFLDKIAIDSANNNEEQAIAILSIQNIYEYVINISGIGDSIANSFKKNFDTIKDQLNSFYQTFNHFPKDHGLPSTNANGGPQVAVTGKFDGKKRSEVYDILSKNGYSVSNKVTSNTIALIAGIGGGGKRAAAKSLNVNIVETDGDLKKIEEFMTSKDRK